MCAGREESAPAFWGWATGSGEWPSDETAGGGGRRARLLCFSHVEFDTSTGHPRGDAE